MPKFKVVGNHAVAGVSPGGQVEFTDEEAAWLIEAGHLEAVATRKSVKQTSDQSEDGDGQDRTD